MLFCNACKKSHHDIKKRRQNDFFFGCFDDDFPELFENSLKNILFAGVVKELKSAKKIKPLHNGDIGFPETSFMK